jgi:hypothetical protein
MLRLDLPNGGLHGRIVGYVQLEDLYAVILEVGNRLGATRGCVSDPSGFDQPDDCRHARTPIRYACHKCDSGLCCHFSDLSFDTPINVVSIKYFNLNNSIGAQLPQVQYMKHID